jgi:hypothetical protein
MRGTSSNASPSLATSGGQVCGAAALLRSGLRQTVDLPSSQLIVSSLGNECWPRFGYGSDWRLAGRAGFWTTQHPELDAGRYRYRVRGLVGLAGATTSRPLTDSLGLQRRRGHGPAFRSATTLRRLLSPTSSIRPKGAAIPLSESQRLHLPFYGTAQPRCGSSRPKPGSRLYRSLSSRAGLMHETDGPTFTYDSNSRWHSHRLFRTLRDLRDGARLTPSCRNSPRRTLRLAVGRCTLIVV